MILQVSTTNTCTTNKFVMNVFQQPRHKSTRWKQCGLADAETMWRVQMDTHGTYLQTSLNQAAIWRFQETSKLLLHFRHIHQENSRSCNIYLHTKSAPKGQWPLQYPTAAKHSHASYQIGSAILLEGQINQMLKAPWCWVLKQKVPNFTEKCFEPRSPINMSSMEGLIVNGNY